MDILYNILRLLDICISIFLFIKIVKSITQLRNYIGEDIIRERNKNRNAVHRIFRDIITLILIIAISFLPIISLWSTWFFLIYLDEHKEELFKIAKDYYLHNCQ